MTIRKMFGRLALSCATLLAACADRSYQPAPIPTATETVAVYRDLPPSLMKPCDKPAWNPADIVTDVDLMGLTARISNALDKCADQVDGIRKVYQKAGGSADGVEGP